MLYMCVCARVCIYDFLGEFEKHTFFAHPNETKWVFAQNDDDADM